MLVTHQTNSTVCSVGNTKGNSWYAW